MSGSRKTVANLLILALLFAGVHLSDFVRFGIGVAGRTPAEIQARFGPATVDTRRFAGQKGETVTDQRFDLCYITWLGNRFSVHFENGVSTGGVHRGGK